MLCTLVAGSSVRVALPIPRMLLPLIPSLALVARRLIPAGGCRCPAVTPAGEAGKDRPAALQHTFAWLLHRYLRADKSLPRQRGLQIIHSLFELTGALRVRRHDHRPHLIAEHTHPNARLPSFGIADLHRHPIGKACRAFIAA